MSFIESYKKLDNLCKDLLQSETGVSTYISDMERIRDNRFQIMNFESDYKKLKHYRYIRNQIVHENYANETNMCNEKDLRWIVQFYKRILNQTDPLSLHQKAVTASKKQVFKSKRIEKPAQSQVINKRTSNKPKIAIPIIEIVIAIISILAIILLIGNQN